MEANLSLFSVCMLGVYVDSENAFIFFYLCFPMICSITLKWLYDQSMDNTIIHTLKWILISLTDPN